jgi:hypothetical protein
MQVKRFHLRRIEDETGISGTGIVTDGLVFEDGSVIMKWNTETTSVGIYQSIEDVIIIHGHGGRTVVDWVDEDFVVFPEFLNNCEAVRYLTA